MIDYLKNGGKAIIVGSYTGNSMPNFESILETYGVGFTGGLVAENDAQHYYNMGGPFYLLPEVNSSSYTGSIGGSYIYIPASMGITFPESSETITYTSLMDTTDRAVSKSDPNQMQDYQYEKGDIEGPFSVGLAVEENVDDENTTQLLVFASPYIFAEEASQMTVNNSVLFSDAISNLVPQTQAAGSIIAEKEYTLDNLTVSAMYAVLLGLMLTIAVPLILVILGIVIFVIRRKK